MGIESQGKQPTSPDLHKDICMFEGSGEVSCSDSSIDTFHSKKAWGKDGEGEAKVESQQDF